MATTTKNPQDPASPENQVDPKWAHQIEAGFNRVVDALTTRTTTVEFVTKQPAQDRENWTTPAEAEKYNRMAEKDYVRLDPKTKNPVKDGDYYRIVHWFPEYQTSNPSEYKSFFVVEQWNFVDAGDGTQRRDIITNFNIRAPEFCKDYRSTVAGVSEGESISQPIADLGSGIPKKMHS
jgi:hypothetical protein